MMAGIVEEFGQTKLTLLPVQPGTKRTAHHCGMGFLSARLEPGEIYREEATKYLTIPHAYPSLTGETQSQDDQKRLSSPEAPSGRINFLLDRFRFTDWKTSLARLKTSYSKTFS